MKDPPPSVWRFHRYVGRSTALPNLVLGAMLIVGIAVSGRACDKYLSAGPDVDEFSVPIILALRDQLGPAALEENFARSCELSAADIAANLEGSLFTTGINISTDEFQSYVAANFMAFDSSIIYLAFSPLVLGPARYQWELQHDHPILESASGALPPLADPHALATFPRRNATLYYPISIVTPGWEPLIGVDLLLDTFGLDAANTGGLALGAEAQATFPNGTKVNVRNFILSWQGSSAVNGSGSPTPAGLISGSITTDPSFAEIGRIFLTSPLSIRVTDSGNDAVLLYIGDG
ncbi:hypothetical protein BDK51DRAFT_40462 [Blyttiomyces helicus]|uniref:Uncharacterized protein n=1 Tax=Blyttiomyces helicus TaxID=388810 RepID=A0A4P9VUX5_9FUNG|nr:hypothetical protein BDK51DRAFT_40462 [Blyttiomyces helicus]|eukprot:RKO83419.1 hypothetical protein BDK51DRAFT_40462 [Blyttiomyces helicus]